MMHPILRSSFLSSLLLILALALPAAPVAPAAEGGIDLQAVIPACNPITTDTTWETGNVYVLLNDCALVVQAGATLTIQPGVIVKLFWTPAYGGPRGAGIRVDGRLVARGTASQPIIFTSYTDDSVGGDTNGDGSATPPAPGDWYGLVLTSGSETILDYVQVRYGSGDLFNEYLDGWAEAQIEVKAGAQFTMTNSEVRAGGRMGVYLNGAGLTPTIQSVHIADHTNTYSHYSYALFQSTINMQPSYADLTFSNNTRNEVTIGDFRGQLAQDVTLGGARFGAFCGYTLCQLIVPAGRTLTVAPGTQLAFGTEYGITVASGGTLRAEGTASQPIIFTSTSPSPSSPVYWKGIWAQQGSTLRLDHCDISYADDGNFGNGGLEIDTGDAQVRNCRIHHNRVTGLYLSSPSGATIAPVLTNVDVTDNGQYGVYLSSYRSVLNLTWDGGRVANNGWAGFYADTSDSSINPTLRNLTIANNGLRGTDRWKQAGIAWDEHNVSPVLENLTLTGNVGMAIFWYCNGSITAHNLTATGNGANELTIFGCTVSGGRQWDLDGAGIPARIAGDIVVAPNALLSLAPGTVLRFDKLWYNTDNTTRLVVQDQASLMALGTAAKPIILTAVNPTAGWWKGIEAQQRATVTLRHCEVAYGGGRTRASVYLWASAVGVPVMNIQNCEIHHSASRGVLFDFDSLTTPTPPILQYNHLHDTAEVAVANWNGPVLDARNNYWGHASGPYHATQNPGGQGDDVGDNILFYPWLAAPSSGEAPGAMLISTGAPTLVSPGETVDYAIQYLNLTTETMRSSVLMMQLPFASEFVGGTGSAIYWPERHQVIWKLGDLAPGAQGFLSVQVRFQWGLPANYTDGSYTIFAAENYNVGALNLAEYNAYQPTLTTAPQVVPLSEGEFTALRNANPTLNTFYQQAMAEGFQFVGAARFTYEDGTRIVNAALRTPNRQYGRVLSLSQDGQVLAYTIGGGQFKAQDTTGGVAVDLAAPVYNFWGSWGQEATLQAAGPTAACGYAQCMANCMFNKHPMWELSKKAASVASTWWIPGVGLVWTAYEVFDTGYTYLECRETCQFEALRSEYCCTAGQERWQPTGLKGQCAKYKCVGGGAWGSAPDIIDTCDFGERCVAGMGASGGCKSCEENLVAYQFTPVALRPAEQVCTASAHSPRCRDLSLRVAKDPNDITGPAGDLLPGQTITYTIRYENEGDGRAYGVYVVNQLPDVFDASTVTFVNRTGTYLPATRELVWTIGELGPKGAADSQGIITYTVRLREGLASGTVVANQAVVYFPSVPEETPTNTWVNLVTPLVATPQNLTTAYMTPLAITLSGREISGLPLTYEIVEPPRGGALTGEAPNLTYTPAENFTGPDTFTFRVSNGTSTSRPAQVYIEVTPQGDTTPPQVLWTDPADGAVGVFASATPVFTDTVGPVYAPVILIGMSEPLDESTVHSGTVTLARSSGAAVAASATFDGGTNQIVLIPRVALGDGEYRVTVTTGVKDQAGNALAAPYTSSFMIGTQRNVYVPLVLR